MRHPFRALLSLRKKEPRLSGIRRAAKKLDLHRLTSDGVDPFRIDASDISFEPSTRLFGFYTAPGVEYALREFGLLEQFEASGFEDIRVKLSVDDRLQTMRIRGRAGGAEHLLVEGRFRRLAWTPPPESGLDCLGPDRDQDAIWIEWLLLQNPLAGFTPERPRLPGQKHPGLGLKDEIMEVFYAVARRLKLDAYLASAKLLHNAFMYSPMFFFIDPARQAELEALRAAAAGRSLLDTTLAVEGGLAGREGWSEPYGWVGETMVCPVSERLHHAYETCDYRRRVEEAAAGIKFQFDWDALAGRRPELIAKVTEKMGGPE